MVDRIDVNRIGLLFLSIQAQDFIEDDYTRLSHLRRIYS